MLANASDYDLKLRVSNVVDPDAARILEKIRQETLVKSEENDNNLGNMGPHHAKILLIQTGGTIDKDYPRNIGGYSFEITEPAAIRILQRARDTTLIEWKTVCQKDSQEMNESDIDMLCSACRDSSLRKIVVTHGTDSLLETAKILADMNLHHKVIVVTGSFRPERFRESDADFNLGMAFGAVQCLHRSGVYVAINGAVAKWDQFSREQEGGKFIANAKET